MNFAVTDLLRVISTYKAPDRGYHGWSHVEACLEQLDQWDHLALDRAALETAILFHDVVYAAGSKANERLSAVACDTFLTKVGATMDFRDKVYELILDTTHAERATTQDGRLIQDIDLSSFAHGNYRSVCSRIRHESPDVPDEAFYPARIKVLEWFLAKSPLYHTEEIREVYEDAAKRYIQYEIDWIKQRYLGGSA